MTAVDLTDDERTLLLKLLTLEIEGSKFPLSPHRAEAHPGYRLKSGRLPSLRRERTVGAAQRAGGAHEAASAHRYDPRHWRDRAEEARRMADQIQDHAARDAMLQAAIDYERLAEEPRAQKPQPPA